MTSTNPLFHLSASEAGRLLAAGEISAVELTDSVLERIHAVESQVRGLVTVTEEQARHAAEAADTRIRAGKRNATHGHPARFERQHLHRGNHDDVFLAHVRGVCTALHRHGGAESP